MNRLLCLVVAGVLALPALAQTGAEDVPAPTGGRDEFSKVFPEAENPDLETFRWTNRPLVVFAENPADPRYIQQMEMLHARAEDLAERDVVVLTDTDPAVSSKLRQKLRPRGFMLALLAKDGTIYLRKPRPWDVREISRVIDKLPTRQQEIRERRENDN